MSWVTLSNPPITPFHRRSRRQRRGFWRPCRSESTAATRFAAAGPKSKRKMDGGRLDHPKSPPSPFEGSSACRPAVSMAASIFRNNKGCKIVKPVRIGFPPRRQSPCTPYPASHFFSDFPACRRAETPSESSGASETADHSSSLPAFRVCNSDFVTGRARDGRADRDVVTEFHRLVAGST